MSWLCFLVIHGCPVIPIDSLVILIILANIMRIAYILMGSLLCLKLLTLSLEVPRLATVMTRPLL
jgi:hypothetical protein